MRTLRTSIATALLAPALLLIGTAFPGQAADNDARIESALKGSYNFKTYLAKDSRVGNGFGPAQQHQPS